MSAVPQRTVGAAGQAATEIAAMERDSAEEEASWKDLESDWKIDNLYADCGSTLLLNGQK